MVQLLRLLCGALIGLAHKLPPKRDARVRISASNAVRDRNSPIKAHQINLQRSLIGSEYQPIRGRGQPFWVCGRDTLLQTSDAATDILGLTDSPAKVSQSNGAGLG